MRAEALTERQDKANSRFLRFDNEAKEQMNLSYDCVI
jgi:hypothetical protein